MEGAGKDFSTLTITSNHLPSIPVLCLTNGCLVESRSLMRYGTRNLLWKLETLRANEEVQANSGEAREMPQRGDNITENSASVVMGKALSHPLRVRILTGMNAPRRRLSASEFAEETGVPLGLVAYHFRKLDRYGCIEEVDTVQRRGAIEHVYLPTKRAMAWTREWERLGPVVRQHLAATALGASVEAIGEAIDKGTFEALPDPILAWDVMPVDEEGEQEVHAIWERALLETLKVGEECEERLGEDPEGTRLLGYLMSTFEAPEIPADANE
jgi:hypothetical protein